MKYIRIIPFYIILNLVFSQNSYAQNNYSETGSASYYAQKFHGKKTSSGEKYDMNKLTAAHNTLPFNTYVKVTNLSNQKCVVVKINDRGPFSKHRIIDLSTAAAKKINLIQSGVAKVKIEAINPSKEKDNVAEKKSDKNKKSNLEKGKIYTISRTEIKLKGYGVQLASYSDQKKLNNQIDKLKPQIKNIYIEVSEVNSLKVYRILSGIFSTKELAQKELKRLTSCGYKGFIRKF